MFDICSKIWAGVFLLPNDAEIGRKTPVKNDIFQIGWGPRHGPRSRIRLRQAFD